MIKFRRRTGIFERTVVIMRVLFLLGVRHDDWPLEICLVQNRFATTQSEHCSSVGELVFRECSGYLLDARVGF